MTDEPGGPNGIRAWNEKLDDESARGTFVDERPVRSLNIRGAVDYAPIVFGRYRLRDTARGVYVRHLHKSLRRRRLG